MKINRLILLIFAVIFVIVTIISFFAVKKIPSVINDAGNYYRSEMIYNKAENFVDKKNYDKAASAFVMVVNGYPESDVAEKSLRRLAEISLGKGEYESAVYYYQRLLKDFPKIKDFDKIKKEIGDLRLKIMKSSKKTGDSIEYEVQPGDSLIKIAKNFNTTVELIKNMNNLRSDIIRIGQRLKINVSKFSIFVDKSDNILILNKDGEDFKTYVISTGTDNSTPVGEFKIINKMVKPPWTKPGVGVITADSDEYELGERWMGISVPSYGIHGTNDESTIGGQVTSGCIRMKNNEVIELYNIVTTGTEVKIVD